MKTKIVATCEELQGELARTREKLNEATGLKNVLETVLDTAYEGIVVVDGDSRITMFNRAYGDFLNIDPASTIGRDVREVIENTRMHEVVRTGKAELRRFQHIKGNDMLCDRIPIFEGDKVVGAVGKVLFRDLSDLEKVLAQAQSLKNELEYYKNELRRQNGTRYSLSSIVGDSPQMKQLKELTKVVARSSTTVLLGGESGTGKELFAHAIHNLSGRSAKPFVKVNCAAMPENLLESELFGYREGAFTGAKKGGKIGKFELADGGTLFLDEIGEMPFEMQVKLLRVLQEREIERLGDSATIPVNVRIIAATNRNLMQMVERNTFRADLYYRLNVISLDVPPLRDRASDLQRLARHFLAKHSQAAGVKPKTLSPEALEILTAYRWPGNVREFENVLERAVTLCEADEIEPAHMPLYVRSPARRRAGLQPLKQVVEEVEAEHIRQALNNAGGNAVKAAKLLGMGKTSLYEKLGRYGIATKGG